MRVFVPLVVAMASLAGNLRAQEPADASGPDDVLRERVAAAVESGLAWLAREQTPSGFWIALIGTRGGRGSYRGSRPIEEQLRTDTGHLGVTAICGIAFLSGGHLPGRGKYGHCVEKSIGAVLSAVQENGLITLGGTRMYSHAFATLFLAEVYGMEASTRVREGLERATHIIVDTQNARGGWRYNAFTRDSDLSVTVCQLQALRAARNIGIEVPKSTIDDAVDYIKRHREDSGPDKGRYYYNIYGRRAYRKIDSYSIQAAAVTSLVSAGVYDADLIDPVLEFLAEEAPEVTRRTPHHYYFWYGNYYASQAFFHADGTVQDGCFARYYEPIRDHLLLDQCADGRWLNPLSEGPGDAFATAMACILLQIPRQYLPIFQR